MTHICLGSAQFGLNYGATNKSGIVSETEIASILKLAHESSLHFIDTAQAYGHSQLALGKNIKSIHDFKIISKLSPQEQASFSPSDISKWDHEIENTCSNLGTKSLDSFLIHNAEDLLKSGSSLLRDWIFNLRKSGIVSRIGISIYDSRILTEIDYSGFDLIQLPLSLYDQRLLFDGTLDLLHSKGIAIHARSIYLQGLLLTPANDWPSWICKRIKDRHRLLEEFALKKPCELIDVALGFIKSLPNLEAIVVGICSQDELKQLLTHWNKSTPWQSDEFKSWSISDTSVIDPRYWPQIRQ